MSKRSRTRTAAWVVGVLAVVVGIIWMSAHVPAAVTGLVVLVAVASGTGLILEHIDRSRSDPDRRPEDEWGYRGRPGA